MALPTVRTSVRKMGTRGGRPHYGAECMTCGTVLAVAHLDKGEAQRVAAQHKIDGCRHSLRYYAGVS